METTIFWQQVRHRRNLFFLCWVGWLPIGGIFVGGYQVIAGHEPPVAVGYSLFYVYGAIWFWTAFRVRQLRCPKCRKSAIATPFFLMRDVKCRHCGLTNEHA